MIAMTIPFLIALFSAPLLPSLILRVRARAGGRNGPHLLQCYFDTSKLLRKGQVIGETTSWVSRSAPSIALGATLVALCIMPFGSTPGLLAFSGDFAVFFALLAVARFAVALAALDTGSALGGLGASRELFFAALAEPFMLLVFLSLARVTGELSMSEMLGRDFLGHASSVPMEMVLLSVGGFIALLIENGRVPFDDSQTHLELTMIREAMTIEMSGIDLAFLQFAEWLKLWIFASLVAHIAFPIRGSAVLETVSLCVMIALVILATGLVESTSARVRLRRVPQLLVGATAFALLIFVLICDRL